MDKKKSKKAAPSKSVLQLFADWMANQGNAMFQVQSTDAAFVIKVMTPDEVEEAQKASKKKK